MNASVTDYRRRVITKHRSAFRFHAEVLARVEDVMKQPRTHGTYERLALDMLLLQSFKANATVSLIAQHGFMEDTATIARRLMELSVTAVYIGAGPDRRVRAGRAGRYLSFLWRQFPETVRGQLPRLVARYWARIAQRHGRSLPANARRWGPNWFDMFKEIGAEELYRSDYSLLSSIAHGSPDNLIWVFSQGTVRVHDDHFVPVFLIYSTRYFLAVIEQWNRRYKSLSQAEVNKWIRRATDWKFQP